MIIQFVQMIPKGHNEEDEFIELSYGTGRHTVEFEGRITGWWKPGSAAGDTSE